ncbi:MAG: penicillin-binding protein 2 [Aquisalinus sp.]|nr:penicillin-binding protein 2 [Aquisalinus sp.]
MRVEPFDTQRHMIFSRRATLFTGGAVLLFAGLGGRLYQLQVRDYQQYRGLADDNRFNQRVIVPMRGEMYDRFGVPLATNRQNFRVLLIPEEAGSIDAALEHLSELITISDAQKQKALREARRGRAFTPIEVASNLTWDEFTKVNFELPNFPGLRSEAGNTRNYPWNDAMAFVVGYVGAPSENDLQQEEDEATRLLYRQPGFRLGRAGLERQHDETLRGQAGSLTVQVNAHGRVIEEYPNDGDRPVQGQSLGLTIDSELQIEAKRILAEPFIEPAEGEEPEPVSASAVVMEIETGDILVMASVPAFDPNEFNVGVSASRWRELNNSPYNPLLNKTLNGVYPPGSTFKLITAIAAQEAGFKPDYRVNCSGKIWFGNRFFECWKPGGHGTMDMRDSIKHSCDTYYWNLAQQLDIDLIADVSKRLGLGQTYDLGLGTQQKGIVPSREWKQRYFRSTPEQQTWFPGDTLSAAIGQGYVASTPLQLAVMTARIASGREIMPRIVRIDGRGVIPPAPRSSLAVNDEHMQIIREGMDAVVNQWGTASRSRLEKPEWRMAGKTGTSQVVALQRDPVTGDRIRNEDLPREMRDHALFVSYAPFDNPRYACAVVIEHGMGGSRTAGPKARDIMNAVMAKDPAMRRAYDPSRDKPVKLSDIRKATGTSVGGGMP